MADTGPKPRFKLDLGALARNIADAGDGE